MSAWIPSIVGMLCVGVQLALLATGATLPRPLLITGLVALAMLGFGVSLLWSLGLRNESVGTRLVILVPIVLSVLLVVALVLDGDFRRTGARG